MKPQSIGLAVLLVLVGATAARAVTLPAEASAVSAQGAEQIRRLEVHGPRGRRRPRHDEAGAVTVLDGDELRWVHRDLSAAVASAAGVQATRAGGFGHGAAVRIRASRPDQVRWAIDDLPIRSPDGAPFDPEDLPLVGLSRAEVYRGATPAALGSEAIGGAVRLGLRRPERAGLEFRLGGGSFGARLMEAAAGWRAAGDGSAAIRYLSSDGDYPYRYDAGTFADASDDRDRVRANNAVHRVGGILRHRLELGGWRFEARYLGAWRRQGLPGLALYEARSARMDATSHLGALDVRRRGALARGDVLRLTLHGGRRGSEVRDERGELGLPQHLRQAVESGGAIGLWRSPVRRRMRLSVRLEGDHGAVRGWDELAGRDRPRASIRELRAGLSLRLHPASGWLLVANLDGAAVVAERFDLAPEAAQWTRIPTSGWRPWSARLSARWAITESIAVHLGATAATRVPNLAELYGNDGTIVGNPLLEPESATSAYAGLRLDLGSRRPDRAGGSFDLQTFASASEGLISLVRTSPIRAVYRNLGAADVAGVEVRARGRIGGRALATAGWSLTRARDRSDRPRPLPMVPLSRWWVRLEGTAHPGQRWWGTVGGSSALSWQAGHFTDRAATVAVPARSSLDFTAWAADREGRLRLGLRLDNLADVRRFDLLGFPLPGRTVMLTLALRSRGGGA